MNSEGLKRYIFPNQSSQVVIIDLNSETNVVINAIKALRDTISLIVSISGPSRIPYFSIITVGVVECVFSLKPIKDNYEDLLRFLDNITNNLCNDRNGNSVEGAFLKNLYAIIKQFNETDLTPNPIRPTQRVEITIVSSSGEQVLKECRELCRNCSVVAVQKIRIISPPNGTGIDRNSNIQASDNDLYNLGEISVDEGVIEVTELRSNHRVVFEDVFKRWLLDSSLDSHHMELIVRLGVGHVIPVKCDLQECAVLPNTLPQASSLCLETDHSVSRTISYATSNRPKMVPVYRMEIAARVSLDGVCESLIFGQPLLVTPSICWRLDVDDVASSQAYLEELRCQLLDSDSGLILQRESDAISSYYLLIPTDNCFVLKCLTCKELLLPRKESQTVAGSGGLVQSQIRDFLGSVKATAEYNPLLYESGIFRSNLLMNKRNKRSQNGVPKNFENKREISFGYHEA